AELVQTDVTVLDKNGRFVEGLRPEQFELLVDGKLQTISFFEQLVAGTRREAAIIAGRTDHGPEANETTVPARFDRGRTIFFFIDDFHLTPGSLTRTREALQRFVTDKMGTADLIAITTASGQLGFLQQLTNDKTVLNLAIERLKTRYRDVSDMGDPPMTEYQAYAIEQNHTDVKELFIEKTCAGTLHVKPDLCTGAGMTNYAVLDEDNTRSDRRGSTSGSRSSSPSATAVNMWRWRAESIVKSRAQRVTHEATQVTLVTLSSLESLIRRAAVLPERKLIIFVSDGFFINFVSSTQGYDLRRLTDAATRTGTVIYTVEARGLTSGLTDATRSGMFDQSGRLARINLSEILAAQQPLYNLAAETGGQAWINSNNLDAGITQAITETSSYYLLAWRPETTEIAKDRFRRIQVNVKDRPDLTVRVRSGFFADDPTAPRPPNASDAIAGMSVDDQLMRAIRASYPSRGIPVILSLGYMDKPEEGLMLAASVQIERPLGNSQEAKGTGDADLDLMGVVSDDSGNILTSQKQKLTIPANLTANAASVVVTFQFPKLAPGLRQVRIAARDSKSGRVGSTSQWIEIPKLNQGNLSLSSVFLTEAAPNDSPQKAKIKPDARFSKTAKLRFRTYVYNAAISASSQNISMQLEFRREGQMLIQTPPISVTTQGVKDLARIPVDGEFPLQDFPTGRYELTIIVTDLSTKKNASQRVKFVIE
ncbi:MAG TPA: VWA domain-containing protein, partial [Pyrinomonadaceae bacterium]